MIKKITLSTFLVLLLGQNLLAQTFRVVGYLPSYRWYIVSSLNYDELTHVCPSFINPNANGDFSFSQDLSQLVSLAHAKNCKVMASIGGGGISTSVANNYKTLTATANRAAFINKLMNYVRVNNLDGVDVDLEGSLVQMSTYNGFVVQLADSLHAAGLEISAALADWTNAYVNAAAANALDFINMMSYDQTGSWAPNNPGPHSTYENAVSDFDYWIGRNQAANKIVLGLPFYGYDFKTAGTASALIWCDIVEKYPDYVNDDEAPTDGGTVYYNGKTTIKNKTQYMLDNEGGGVMIWELGQDCTGDNSLFNLITETISVANSAQSALSANSFVVYPNPVNSQLNFQTPLTGEYQIFNLEGKEVARGEVVGNAINVEALPQGSYLVKINSGQNIFTQQFVK